MTDGDRVLILQIALRKACKFLRDNPPGDLDRYPQDMITGALIGGGNDPEGNRYLNYFLTKAIEEIG